MTTATPVYAGDGIKEQWNALNPYDNTYRLAIDTDVVATKDDLSEYAKKTDIPSLDDYAKKDDVPGLIYTFTNDQGITVTYKAQEVNFKASDKAPYTATINLTTKVSPKTIEVATKAAADNLDERVKALEEKIAALMVNYNTGSDE